MKENTMKPKRPKKIDVSKYEGKCGEKSTLSQALKKLLAPAPLKPLDGKLLYLDLPSNRLAETLERDIVDLGGTVEKFFSKEIKYLVTNKREAKYVGGFKSDSPVPSPEPGSPAPNPATRCADNKKGQTQARSCVASRGKSLVERVVKEKERLQMNKMLSKALEWGVKILYIDDVIKYINKKKCTLVAASKPNIKTGPAARQSFQKCRAGRICKPFVKVEDCSKHYRPIYLSMPNMPELNRNTVPPATPFYLNEKGTPGKKHRNANPSSNDGKAPDRKKFKDRQKAGFCECCLTKYENLAKHLKSESHKDFSKSDNYRVVDKLISDMPFRFLNHKTDTKRPKCSVTPALMITRLKQGVDVDARKHRMSNDCPQVSVDRSVPPSGSSHREQDKRTLPWSNSKCYKRNRLQNLKQNSLKCAQTSNEITSQKMEIPPTGVTSASSSFVQSDTFGEISNISTSRLHDSKLVTREAELKETESSPEQMGHASPKKTLGHSDEGRTPTSSPAQKLQRKVQPARTKRRKETPFVGHKRLRSSVDPIRRLWEIFQSSDDTDMDFTGFEG